MRDTIDMAREIAAQYIKAERFQTWTHDYMMERLMELVSVSAATEREACAKVAEDSDHVVDGRTYYDQLGDANATARNIVAAIRARSQT